MAPKTPQAKPLASLGLAGLMPPMSVATGLIGAGAFGANHARKLASLPLSRFVGVFDADRARASALAAEHGVLAFSRLEDLLAGAEAVVIATPAITHADLARAVLTAGKHALVEKPLSARANDARALVQPADQKSLVLQAGHQERFVLEALGLFSAPEQPKLLEIARETPFTGRGMDVSVTLDLMIHDLDLVALLFGAPPSAISARGRKVHGGAWDQVNAELSFASGSAELTASRCATARRRVLRVTYPSGVVQIDMLSHTIVNATPLALNPDFERAASDPLGQAVNAFLEAVVGRAASAIPGAAGAAAVELADLIDRVCVEDVS